LVFFLARMLIKISFAFTVLSFLACTLQKYRRFAEDGSWCRPIELLVISFGLRATDAA
jgi:hypothetical protein